MRAFLNGLAVVLAAVLGELSFAASPASDTIEQRVKACTACHDTSGRRGPDAYYPRIAGKPAGYLYNQLQHFREGRRFYALMTYLVDHLPEPYLLEIADHFASQQPPYPAPQPTTARPEALERGRTLALEGDAGAKLPACAQCHGKILTGVVPAIPAVVGLPRDYIVAQLNAWRSGVRRALEPDCMADIAKRLRADDIAAVASWLASQPVPGRAASAPETHAPIACGGVPGGQAR